MPSLRWLLPFTLPLLLSACNDEALKQRAEEIRQFSDKQDRTFTAEALTQIQHKYWTLHDHVWYGKLPDSTIIRLNAPHAILAPLPSQALNRGWHLQVTIVSEDWRTYPDAPHSTPYAVIYAITRQSATNWDIRVLTDQPTSPLHHDEALRVQTDQ